jgi:hypothetical protein
LQRTLLGLLHFKRLQRWRFPQTALVVACAVHSCARLWLRRRWCVLGFGGVVHSVVCFLKAKGFRNLLSLSWPSQLLEFVARTAPRCVATLQCAQHTMLPAPFGTFLPVHAGMFINATKDFAE